MIRVDVSGDEPAIHAAHLRSIREVCVKDHGQEEGKDWEYRPLEDRWIKPIKEGFVWVVEDREGLQEVACLPLFADCNPVEAFL